MSDRIQRRDLTRRDFLRAGAAGVAAVGLGPLLAACASGPKTSAATATTTGKAGGKITIGSFQDNAMKPFRDTYIKRFAKETGIQVEYNETNYDTWYQNAKNDGLHKTGAYDIYVMDDNWVPEFAAGKVIQSLTALGFKPNADILPRASSRGTGRRSPARGSRTSPAPSRSCSRW